MHWRGGLQFVCAFGCVLWPAVGTNARADDSPAFFRVLSPSPSVIAGWSTTGYMVWSNAAVGVTSQIQRSLLLAESTNWTDYVQSVVTDTVMSLRILDWSAPAGMVWIPSGLNIGTAPDAGPYSLTNAGIYMDRAHVTEGFWQQVRDWGATNGYTDLPLCSTNGPALPVDRADWYSAVKWCNARSEMESRPVCYRVGMDVYRTGAWETVACDFSAAGYRLPTMAEWEFAARGGLRGKRFPWGDEIDPTKANYGCNVDNVSVAGTYPANGYGLFDIVGNLWHWTWDRYPEESQQYRSLRGGSWLDSSNLCECAFAGFSYPGLPHYTCSFRTVMATTGP